MGLADFGNVLKKIGKAILPIAPVIASGLGGPAALAVPAVRILANALGVDPDIADVETQILSKIEKATPQDLLNIKQANNQYILDMEKLGVDRARIEQEDRHSARQRQIQLGDKFPNWLAIVTLIVFAGCLYFIFTHISSPDTLNKEIMALIAMLTGHLAADVKQIYNYYFGSSAGSKRKSEIMERMSG